MCIFILGCYRTQVRRSLALLFPSLASYVHQSIFANNRKKVRSIVVVIVGLQLVMDRILARLLSVLPTFTFAVT